MGRRWYCLFIYFFKSCISKICNVKNLLFTYMTFEYSKISHISSNYLTRYILFFYLPLYFLNALY